MQLLTYDYADLGPPRWGALAWLTQTAIRKAWELDNNERRAHGVVPDDTDDLAQQAAASGHLLPGADEFTEQHMRMDLVKQIPERPRRFLLPRARLHLRRDRPLIVSGGCRRWLCAGSTRQ